jgi:hypothetical protein
VVNGQGRQYVALLIDPSTGEIEAYGPADELNAVLLAEELRVALAADAELREGGGPHPAAAAHCGAPCRRSGSTDTG